MEIIVRTKKQLELFLALKRFAIALMFIAAGFLAFEMFRAAFSLMMASAVILLLMQAKNPMLEEEKNE